MFKLVSKYKPLGDQPKAIEEILNNFKKGYKRQVLLGATGTGKTFTISNIIKEYNKPTLILAHNKTLAGQLYNEIKQFFPENRVEFFISYYDYYQPEAYVAASDTYIEKDARINDEIDEMRHSATSALMNEDDVIVVASVSCIYGIGDPEEYKKSMYCLRVGDNISKRDIIKKLIDMQYERNEIDIIRGTFRFKGDVLEIIPPQESKKGIRIEFFDTEVESIKIFDIITGRSEEKREYVNIFAASHFISPKDKLEEGIRRIEEELKETREQFIKEGKLLEAERITNRTRYDLEMLRETGTCQGVENYSRHLTLREEGETPATLIDFFPKDFLLIVDESHVTLPQVKGMYNGDRERKLNLVEYGFRLKSALDNRPLKFEEFDKVTKNAIYVSATPKEWERKYPIVEQIIRPTGLLDPLIIVKETKGQIDHIYEVIKEKKKLNERVLITTLTIRMSEDLTSYLKNLDIKVAYIHSKIKSLERLEILRDLRIGKYDCLVGINLLREGLDLPEVSTVCILDADKQGFLRSESALIQTIGRAARNSNGTVYLYADTISDAMNKAITETKRRREIQEKYNKEHGIIPSTIIKEIPESLKIKEKILDEINMEMVFKSEEDYKNRLKELEELMIEYAKDLKFEEAAKTRDLIAEIKKVHRYNR